MAKNNRKQLVESIKVHTGNNTFIDTNHVFVDTLDTFADTIAQVKEDNRHKGLYVTYLDKDTKEVRTYIYNHDNVDYSHWTDFCNWKEYEVSGEISNFKNLNIEASAVQGDEAKAVATKLDDNTFEVAFTIPRGERGAQGPKGDAGERGPQGLPGKDGTPGRDGVDGVAQPSTRMKYKYCLSGRNPDVAPTINKTNSNPGANWIDIIPIITNNNTQAVWITSAEFNADGELIGEWATPAIYIMYGQNGLPGPTGPQGPKGDQGIQGVAGVQGPKGDKGSNPYIGDDGYWWIDGAPMEDENGNKFYALGTGDSTGTPPNLPDYNSYVYIKSATKPSFPVKPNGEKYTTIKELLANTAWQDYPDSDGQWWQIVFLVSGSTHNIIQNDYVILPVNGKDGSSSEGGTGLSERMLFLWSEKPNTRDKWEPWWNSFKNTDPSGLTGWSMSPGQPNNDGKDYGLMMIHAQINDDGTLAESWSFPVDIKGEQGVQGIPGTAGQRGPVLYPAGVFKVGTTYYRDGDSAPYVHYVNPNDSEGNEWWYLNTLGEFKSTTESNNPYTSPNWKPFKSFEAIFAKIGIIGNGLIGQAVFNGSWMFSQRGIDDRDEPTSQFQLFNRDDPFNPNNEFRPAFALNFSTGEIYFANGVGQLNESGIQLYKGEYKITFDETGIKLYKGVNLVNSFAFDGTVTNELTVSRFKRTIHDSNIGTALNGSIIITGTVGQGVYLPELKYRETIDILYINMGDSKIINDDMILSANENVVFFANRDSNLNFDQTNKGYRYKPDGQELHIIGIGTLNSTEYKFIVLN